MVDAKKTQAVRKYMTDNYGFAVEGFFYVEDSNGEKWQVLVGFDDMWSVWHDKRWRKMRVTLVGQDSDGTVSRQAMEDALWKYFRTYPEYCVPGTMCSLDAAVAHELSPNTYGVMYHTNAWAESRD